MSLDPSMRASDADREAVAGRLRDAHAEGRLTMEEFQTRLDSAYAARTLGELTPLTRDLPAPSPQAPVTRPHRAGLPAHPGLRGAWRAWATATLVCTVIWLAGVVSGGGGWQGFWPVWVAGPWGAVLLARTTFGGPQERPGRRDGERDHP